MAPAVDEQQVQVKVDEEQRFVDDGVSRGQCKRYAQISCAVLLAAAVQSALTAGLVSAAIGGGQAHVGQSGALEDDAGEPVATAGLVEVRSGAELGAMTPEELKEVRTVELPGDDGEWSAYHIASVHKLGFERIELVALDGTKITVVDGVPSVSDPSGSEGQARGPARRLPHYTTYGGTSYDFAPEVVKNSLGFSDKELEAAKFQGPIYCCCLAERRLEGGRRLPHYTTYGGTSYDFAGCSIEGLRGPVKESYNPTRPPAMFAMVNGPKADCCCPVKEIYNPRDLQPQCKITLDRRLPKWQVTMVKGTVRFFEPPTHKGTVVGNPGTGKR